ncbi:MAG: hypothetical protein ABIQ04_00355 [Candidatus Saccharimonadales bacterium]
MLTDLSRYNLPPMHTVTSAQEQEENDRPSETCIVSAMNIIRRTLSRHRRRGQGLTREALWKRFDTDKVGGTYDERLQSFEIALARLKASSEVNLISVPEFLGGKWVGDTSIYRITPGCGSSSKQVRSSKAVRQIA